MQIYKTTNLINGKIYVGQEKGNNEQYLGSGKIIRYAIEKYGIENFKKDIIKKCWSIEEMNESEKYWIKALESRNPNIGYNISGGGEYGDTLSMHPDKIEIYKKISQTRKPNLKEIHKKISIGVKQNAKINPTFGMKGKKQSHSARKKLSIAHIGIKLSNEHKKKISEGCKIKLNTEEIRKKMSDAHCKKGLGQKCSEETKRKISIASKNWKKDICIYCGIETTKPGIVNWHNEKCKLNPNLNIGTREKPKWTDERRIKMKEKFLLRKQTPEYNSEENKKKRSDLAKLSHLTRKLNKGGN